MNKTLLTDDVISIIAERAHFTKSDVKIILDMLIELFIESVKNNTIIKIRGFGRLYQQRIPVRKGSKGQMLPETNRVIFKLAEPIRYADKEEYNQMM